MSKIEMHSIKNNIAKEYEDDNEKLLKNFIEEFFDYDELQKVGFWGRISKTDYKKQAERICKYFGLKTIYEYGSEPIKAHLTYAKGDRPDDEPFVTESPSIYE